MEEKLDILRRALKAHKSYDYKEKVRIFFKKGKFEIVRRKECGILSTSYHNVVVSKGKTLAEAIDNALKKIIPKLEKKSKRKNKKAKKISQLLADINSLDKEISE